MNKVEACPICSCSEFWDVPFPSRQEIGDFAICECRHCTHRYLLSPPSDELLGQFYEQLFGGDRRASTIPRPGWRDVALRRLLTPLLPIDAHLLDIGANFGETLLAFPDSYRLEGVELSNEAAQVAARSKRLKIHRIAIEKANFPPADFDCVLALAVIEHIRAPLAFAQKIAELLRPGGIAVIMTGDHQSWRASELGEDWLLYHATTHLHFFSSLSFELALQQAGLIPFERIWAGPNPLSIKLGRFGRILHCQTTSLIFPRLFGYQSLGDELYVFARKR